MTGKTEYRIKENFFNVDGKLNSYMPQYLNKFGQLSGHYIQFGHHIQKLKQIFEKKITDNYIMFHQ